MTILETHISLRLHRPTKNSKTNPILINSIGWNTTVCQQQQDLWPVATRKGHNWTNTIVNTTHIYVYIFSLMYLLTICTSLQHCIYIYIYMYNMTFVMSLLFWNFCMCNVYCSFLLVTNVTMYKWLKNTRVFTMVFVLHWLPFSCGNRSQILLLWWHTGISPNRVYQNWVCFLILCGSV